MRPLQASHSLSPTILLKGRYTLLEKCMAHFIKDVEDLRRRALDKMEDGPVTRSY
jgi:hypothetical protein